MAEIRHYLLRLFALFFIVFSLGLVVESLQKAYSQTGHEVVDKAYVIRITGVIDSSTEEYVKNAISRAEDDNALLIIELNTPGGFLDPAMDIVVQIDKARIPVVGFVVDKWAESAGTLILVSCHVAAMQPSTQIGSMQPIEYDPTTGSYRPVNESKIINPILKFLDEHAASKGRNKTILHKFVTENLNLGASEALEYGVIDYVARNDEELLSYINGSELTLPSGYTVDIRLRDLTPIEYNPSPRQVIVHALSDPLLSGLLLSLGVMIIVFSVLSGHAAFLGVGAFLLLLGLMGSGYNVNLTVTLLLVIGAILLVIELYTPGFGIIGGTGIVMLTLGLILIPVSGGISLTKAYADELLHIIYAVGISIGAFFAFVIYKIVKARSMPSFNWSVKGRTGKALSDIDPGSEGIVLVDGEYWKAYSDESIRKGDTIVVIDQFGLRLKVKKAGSTSISSHKESA